MSCENCEESAYVIDKLAKLLAEIAVIVNGVEPHDTSWSYHDLPEKVRALKQAQQPAAAVPAGFADWLAREMPAGTVIGDPHWWAKLIARRFAQFAAPPAAVVPDDAIEAAYWDFDARHKGYGPHKTTPQSERDAFKWAVRAMLAAAERKGVES